MAKYPCGCVRDKANILCYHGQALFDWAYQLYKSEGNTRGFEMAKVAFEAHFEGQYPCGCRPGFFLCPEAERLWRESVAHSCEGDWKMYDVKRGEYDEHYKRQEDER